jgi:hypothetical protein
MMGLCFGFGRYLDSGLGGDKAPAATKAEAKHGRLCTAH